MGFVWVTDISVGAAVDAADRNETKTNIAGLYVALGKNWPGNVRFPGCGGAGFDMAVPCPVVWDIAVGDSIYQTPGAHPVSELQEARDKLDFLEDDHCGVDNATHDDAEDIGEDAGANVGANTGEDVGDDTGADSGDDTSEDSGDYVSAQVGEDTGENVGADSGANTGEDSGANAGANTGEDVGANSGADIGEDVGQHVGANTAEDIGADSAEDTNDDFGDFGTYDSIYRLGDCLADDAGNYSGDNDTNWVANDIVDQITVLAAPYEIDPGFCITVNNNNH